MDRRALLAVALAGLVALSGCALLTGGTLEFSAGPATVTEDAQSAAQYDLVGVDTQSINRTVSVAGQERTVEATNHIATYERDLVVTTSEATGTVVVVSTPQMAVVDRPLNPVGSMSPRQLLEAVAANRADLSDVAVRDNRTTTILGENATVTAFDATTEFGGQSVDVTVHLVRVAHDGDFVIGVAVHPSVMTAEQAGVDQMFEGIEHTGS
ncbi:MAG: DUF6517 family protein [Halobacteriota archaeon]|uniref:DUF6517 family protein n=1 Tax=Halodesulfurarchaeum sp. HSR-GB TaxID=3074077 RepID=UPI00285E53C3|nr:DUF6517 family protein [Halodesulfurarchaeum sp. HSR-GB]MDR5655770.1 DUF6517 family protein [Halodesulfurarchaeum sp. HSR-GB]